MGDTEYDDNAALNRIALLLRVVNQTDSTLSGKGIDVLTEIVEKTGREAH